MTTLRTPVGSAGARIIGLGAHLPTRVVTNDEVAVPIDSSDEWIRTRSGIGARRFAAADETVADMGTEAAAKAIASSGVDPSAIDFVLVSTCTNRRSVPGVAAEVAHRVGATGAGALDVNATCAGFCYALAMAADVIRGGNARNVLVVGSERMTNILDSHDRSTSFLFGDGAGAAVVAPDAALGIGPVAWGSDASAGHIVGQDTDEPTRCDSGLLYLRMDGPAVFRWAVTGLGDVARRACDNAGIDISELAAFVPHQANARIVDSLVRSLKLPEQVYVARDIVDIGNTSSASIPIALSRMVETGVVASGSPALLLGFGAGLAYAGQVILMP